MKISRFIPTVAFSVLASLLILPAATMAATDGKGCTQKNMEGLGKDYAKAIYDQGHADKAWEAQQEMHRKIEDRCPESADRLIDVFDHYFTTTLNSINKQSAPVSKKK